MTTPDGIAVIGMAGRFPGAAGLLQFWENLCAGKESITFFTEEELAAAGAPASVRSNPNYVPAAARLADIEWFDADFFGYTPKEAAVMDPQHRVFLECAWEALEEAGYSPDKHDGAIGVFAGTAVNSYFASYARRLGTLEGDILATFLGNAADFLSTRVSYKLDLRGPSLTIQTACSTSLVAVHVACQSLLSGECDLALAGGVSIKVADFPGYFHQAGGIASPDGRCRAFDARAAGTLFGDGAGVVVLKRAADAIADGDHVYAIIRGSAVNNDGASKVGYTAPSVNGQAEVVAEALAVAGIDAGDIGLIEAHGTGTALGDPMEISALTQAFRVSADKAGYCAIGSVKTNIGHLDAAAGVAGLIKAALALHFEKIPPSLHYEAPNPEIDFASSPFFVNAELRDWKRGPVPRRAGVSSFGMGGTNAHVILEEGPLPVEGADALAELPLHLLTLSAKTPSALQALAARYGRYFDIHPETRLADAAFTSQTGRVHFACRLAVLVSSTAQARESLSDFVAGRTAPEMFHGVAAPDGGAVCPSPAPQNIEERRGALAKLARQFVEGADVDWRALHTTYVRRRVSLPVYPFERKRYWLEEERRAADAKPAAEFAAITATPPDREKLEAAAPEARRDLLVAYLTDQVLRVLGRDPGSTCNTRQGFFDMGMESLATLELKAKIEAGLGCTLPVTFAMNYPNIEGLAGFLADSVLNLQAASMPPAVAPEATADRDGEMDGISEEDLAALLDAQIEQVLGGVS